jgi:LysR family nitrogen assimilation transcriptional regulator
MTFDELRYFLKTAETGSMTRAAERLGITQPALSRQIRQLEAELRSDLFYRHGRGVSLTAAGLKLQAVAASVLDQLNNIRQEIQEEYAQASGVITLGVPPSLGTTLCATLSQGFAKAFPDAHLRIREGFSGNLSEMLEDGQLDAAILYDARRRRDLIVNPLIIEGLYFISNPKQAIGTATASWKDIQDVDLILPGPRHGMRRVIERAAKESGITLNIRFEIDSVPAIRQLVTAGMGASILPYGAVHAEVRSQALAAHMVDEPGMEALLVIATPRNKPVTQITRSLIKLIEKETRACIRSGILKGKYRPRHPLEDGQDMPFDYT